MKFLNLKSLIAVVILFVASGCAHKHGIEGVQAEEKIPAGVRVRIGGSEVKDGDQIHILKKVCQKQYSGGRYRVPTTVCSNKVVAKGTVLKVLDHDSAVIQVEGGFQLEPDMTVEKINP